MNIKDMVSDNKKVKFVSFREGEFIYSTECGFEFPVPLADIGKATLLAEDKALLFLRYIRKHVELIEKGPKTVPITRFSSIINLDESVKDTSTENTVAAFKTLAENIPYDELRVK